MNSIPDRQVFSKSEKTQTSTRAITVDGAIDLSFKGEGQQTVLDRLYYRDPMKVLFPRPQQGDPITAALVTTGGGLFGGDRYDISIALAEKSSALVTAQAAEKIYKSSGPDCLVDLTLNIGAKAQFEWLPQETIIFDMAQFRRKTKLCLQKDSQVLAGEFIVLGRLASGEILKQGLVRDAWDVSIDGKRVWADALHLEGDLHHVLNHPSSFDGAKAYATAVYYAPDAEDLLELVREYLGVSEQVRSGASYVNGLLICRWLADDPYELRQAFGSFWAKMRHKTLGRAAQLPRLWHC